MSAAHKVGQAVAALCKALTSGKALRAVRSALEKGTSRHRLAQVCCGSKAPF
jgi:hypothetical protein